MLPAYDALVIRSKFKLTAALLEACPKLKCIGRAGAGMENIDLAFAETKGIVCLNAPEGNCDAVGEHAMGMLLMLLNHLKRADAEVREGIWTRAENRGTEISGKTIGIIGYGNMGQAFAQRLRGFSCRVLAHDKYKQGFAGEGVEEASLEQIFDSADIVSLHVPLTEETRYMVTKDFINHFRKSFYLINTARGQCVETKAVVEALASGKMLGACLDVLEYESISFENINAKDLPADFRALLQSDKVILSPHIAGWTHESNYKISRLLGEKMIAVLEPFKEKYKLE